MPIKYLYSSCLSKITKYILPERELNPGLEIANASSYAWSHHSTARIHYSTGYTCWSVNDPTKMIIDRIFRLAVDLFEIQSDIKNLKNTLHLVTITLNVNVHYLLPQIQILNSEDKSHTRIIINYRCQTLQYNYVTYYIKYLTIDHSSIACDSNHII